MYLSLLGNLRLWSVISNDSSYGKVGHSETGRYFRKEYRSVDI